MPDRSGAVDHVGDPAGYHAEYRRHPVALPDPAAAVAEQGERQVVPAREGGVPVGGVGADPDHLGAGVGECLITVAEGAGLGGTAAGVVLRVEVQDDPPVAEPVLQPDLLARLRRKGEVGSLVPDSDGACHACLPLPGSGRRQRDLWAKCSEPPLRVRGDGPGLIWSKLSAYAEAAGRPPYAVALVAGDVRG